VSQQPECEILASHILFCVLANVLFGTHGHSSQLLRNSYNGEERDCHRLHRVLKAQSRLQQEEVGVAFSTTVHVPL
jgi:hypothetical protein